jgi:hypothetical protein
MRFQSSLFFVLLCFSTFLNAQSAVIYGRITDVTNEQSVDLATVYVKETKNGVSSDESGKFSIQVPANQRINLVFRRIGYKETQAAVLPLNEGARYGLDISMVPSVSTIEAVISERRLDEGGMVKERNIKDLKLLPTTTGNLESVLPHIALGTNAGTGGELSSQYQVRGGNYDENLVYVNDFEIYRPQLIRAGQQEGLTFANIWFAIYPFLRVVFKQNMATNYPPFWTSNTKDLIPYVQVWA